MKDLQNNNVGVIPKGRVKQMKKVFQKAPARPAKPLVPHQSSLDCLASPPPPPRTEIPIREWLTLPLSSYHVRYELGSTTTDIEGCTSLTGSNKGKERSIPHFNTSVVKSPFEVRMQELRWCLQEHYPGGAGIVYVREIFEPLDPEFQSLQCGLMKQKNHQDCRFVNVKHITKQQVDRLHIIIVDDRRRKAMVAYLKMLEVTVPNYGHFKEEYSKVQDPKERLNKLLGFTFALNKHDNWLYQTPYNILRVRMIKNLGLKWRNLLGNRSPKELGIDDDFSLPAIKALLEKFKCKVEKELPRGLECRNTTVFSYRG